MFRKRERIDSDDRRLFHFETGIQEKNPLTAVPADSYACTFQDADGNALDDGWIKDQCDAIPVETLDATSGAYLDHEVVSAMNRALATLTRQRKGIRGHIEVITSTEERESKMAEDISRAIDSQLEKLEAAKYRTAKILAK